METLLNRKRIRHRGETRLDGAARMCFENRALTASYHCCSKSKGLQGELLLARIIVVIISITVFVYV
jgi:hypothetical protein